jgi:hypothetical protein
MHYGPPKEIFGWAMAHPKYRVAPPMLAMQRGAGNCHKKIIQYGSKQKAHELEMSGN